MEPVPLNRSRCQRALYPYNGRIYCYNDASGAALDENGLCINCCSFSQEWATTSRFLTSGNAKPQEWKEHYARFLKHAEEHHGRAKKLHEGNGRPIGAFAFTLTYSPDDGLTEADLIVAVRKVMNQRSCPVKRYAWYLEYGDPETKRHPHIHGLYETETGGVIENKYWKRAWDIWNPKMKIGKGHRGGYHRPVRDDEDYSNYIKKQKILGESIGCHAESTAASPAAPPASPADTDESE